MNQQPNERENRERKREMKGKLRDLRGEEEKGVCLEQAFLF
jgi:hypothetical protein